MFSAFPRMVCAHLIRKSVDRKPSSAKCLGSHQFSDDFGGAGKRRETAALSKIAKSGSRTHPNWNPQRKSVSRQIGGLRQAERKATIDRKSTRLNSSHLGIS